MCTSHKLRQVTLPQEYAVFPKSGILFSRQPLTKRAATRCDEVAEMQRLVDAGASLTAGAFTPLFGAAEFGQVRGSAIILSAVRKNADPRRPGTRP